MIAEICHHTNEIIKEIDKLIAHFLLNGRDPKVKFVVAGQIINKGGLKFQIKILKKIT